MTKVGQREIITQRRVIKFFEDELEYTYLGHWKDRKDNDNVEGELLIEWLARQGHTPEIITRVFRELDNAKALSGSKALYDANRAVYSLLRYGVQVSPDVGEKKITVPLIDWNNVKNNDFGIAEEVTVAGVNDKRPDLVLYVNGIALGVIELKRSTISVSEGIRQNLDNQKREFIRPFFATVQLVMAGNDTEGMRYGVIETPEKYYLNWKEEGTAEKYGENPLDGALGQVCRKERLLEIVHDFMVFDAGIKKVCRHNQYFGVQAAHEHVRRREGGIIWHTQGSGKSLTMVWLARWLRENVENARVLIITDRTELDDQIEKVFKGVGESIYRTKSGADMINALNAGTESLMCSLIQKFGASEEGDVDGYVRDIEGNLPKDFQAKGELFVFVDECHRTHSNKLHAAMKKLLPGAMLIGFTGTPLLRNDKRMSLHVFGPYIHTYKYDEAVADGVVLDLRYEARDIDQHVTSQKKIDQWFDMKTRGLTDLARAQLKQRWGTMKKVLSSRSRLEMIVHDILVDMGSRDRLMSGKGNAILVSGSIYSACQIYEMFQKTDLAGKCAIITSYEPTPSDIKGEESGEGKTEKVRQYGIYRKMLADHFDEPEDEAMGKIETFEKEAKQRFLKEPGRMKLLIVVNKLLTGFDAPPATYLYIDKRMENHGLFQAICRVNRLDGDDKEYGYVIDYKDLFKSLKKSFVAYTGEAFDQYDAEDVAGLLKNRLDKGRERLEEVREAIKALCEPVELPRDTGAYLRFFCAETGGDIEAMKENEPKRVALYKLAGSFVRAYAELANEMEEAGYTEPEAKEIKEEVAHYDRVRDEVNLSSGDYIDMKMYEPAMRHLLDTYIHADPSETLSKFDDMSLVELIIDKGEEALESLPKGIRENEKAMAETIENNVRKLIIDEMAVNPKYYESMSEVLDALIQARKQEAINYKAYLAKMVELTRKVGNPGAQTSYPPAISSRAQRALYDNLDKNEELAIKVDAAIREVKKDDWKSTRPKRMEVRGAIKAALGDDGELLDEIYRLAENQRDY